MLVLALILDLGCKGAGAADAHAQTASFGSQELEVLNRLAAGGVNPDVSPTQAEFEQLHRIGIRRLRLINVDRNVTGVQADGRLQACNGTRTSRAFCVFVRTTIFIPVS